MSDIDSQAPWWLLRKWTDSDGEVIWIINHNLYTFGSTNVVNLAEINDPVKLARAVLAAARSTARVVEDGDQGFSAVAENLPPKVHTLLRQEDDNGVQDALAVLDQYGNPVDLPLLNGHQETCLNDEFQGPSHLHAPGCKHHDPRAFYVKETDDES